MESGWGAELFSVKTALLLAAGSWHDARSKHVTFLPIVERELRVASRKAATFRWRIWVAVLTSLGAAALLLINSAAASATSGKGVFGTLTVLAFLFCLLDGARNAADSLSEEKREGTLGLLFLTDLSGYDVVLGKLAASTVKSFQGLFAFLPVLAVALILGGVTAGEFWRTAAVLANTLFFSASVGLCISSLSRESHRALSGTLACIALITAVPLVVTGLRWTSPFSFWNCVAGLSPGSSALLIPSAMYVSLAGQFWFSFGATHAMSWGFLILASVVTPRAWQDKPVDISGSRKRDRRFRWRFGSSEERAALRRRLLEINPILWLAARNDRQRWTIRLLLGGVGIVVFGILLGATIDIAVPVIAVVLFLAALVLQVWVASQASSHLAEARRNGTMEILLGTPLTMEEIIRGQWLALERHFFWAAMILIAARIATVGIQFFVNLPARSEWLTWLPMTGSAIYESIKVVLDLAAMAWLGMLMGISQRNPHVALARTLFYGLLLPILVFCIPTVLVDLVIIRVARGRLRRNFRTLVSEIIDPRQKNLR